MTRGRGVSEAMTAVREAPSIVVALRSVDDLVTAAGLDDGSSVPCLLDAVADPADQLAAIGAVHGLAALPGAAGRPALVSLLDSPAPHLREHAAWALGDQSPVPEALGALLEMLTEGGFAGMLAQRTLERWGEAQPDAVRPPLERTLRSTDDPGARARVVETLGLVPGRATVDLLLDRALDEGEEPSVRAAAVAALGDGAPEPVVLRSLRTVAHGDGPLADTACAALHDLETRTRLPGRSGSGEAPPAPATSDAVAVVQLFLHADIDAGLSHAGRGDTGGIATLLVQLGDALLDAGRSTTRAVTLSRGRPRDATLGLDDIAGPGHHYASVPLWGPPVHAAEAWPLRVTARRGIRRVLRAAQPDLVHLRMADVGSMAAAEAAAELGVPTVLTLAPDPHALVQARDQAGTLTRAGFGEADLAEHLVFRDRLLRRLASDAAHLVLFPRPTLRADLQTLLGIDLDDPAVRATVVAEGIDLSGIDRARREVAAADVAAADAAEEPRRAPPPPALADLDSLLGSLTPERRHLPVAISVGRLHRVKGMATLVETWARHGELSDRCNLLVVGGDLEAPNDDEASELTRIRAEVPDEDAARRGLILAGHRPNSVVRLWMAAVRRGRPGLAAPAGVYVAASLKEEFGIAIVEALTSGLVVVAPDAGGPATYVEQGVTGVLVDTSSPEALAEAVTSALDLAADPGEAAGADSARAALRERFGIDATATALDEVYRGVASAHRRAGGRGQGRALEPAPASSGARS